MPDILFVEDDATIRYGGRILAQAGRFPGQPGLPPGGSPAACLSADP